MQLQDNVFEPIIRALGAIPEGNGDLRRRRTPRFNVDREVAIKPYGVANAVSHPVTLVNLSAGGVCIVARQPISVGDQFIISLHVPGRSTMEVLCIVRQSRLTPTRAYRVGAEFLNELEREHRLARSIEKPKTQTDFEPGSPGTQAALLHRDGKAVAADVRSSSEGLFQVTIAEAVMPGEQVLLELPLLEGRQVWRCSVLESRDLPPDRHLITLKIDGPGELPQHGGPLSWLSGLFRRS